MPMCTEPGMASIRPRDRERRRSARAALRQPVRSPKCVQKYRASYFSKKWPFGTQGPPAAAHAHKNTAPPLAPPENNTLAAQVTCSYESTQNKFPECPVGPTADGRPSVACVRYPHFASSTAPDQPTPASLRCRPDHLATRATSWHRSARLEAPGASKIAALAVSSGQQPDRASDPPPLATRNGLPDPRDLAHRGRRTAQPPCTAQAGLREPRPAVESADTMSTILACETGARSGVRAPCSRATG